MDIFDLKLLGGEQLHAAIEKAGGTPAVPTGCVGLVETYRAGDYRLAVFSDAVFCSCPAFKFGKGTACKHLGQVLKRKCFSCSTEISAGDYCKKCTPEHALYLKERKPRKAEVVAGIRIN